MTHKLWSLVNNIHVINTHLLLTKASHLVMPNFKGGIEGHSCHISERQRDRNSWWTTLMITTLLFLGI